MTHLLEAELERQTQRDAGLPHSHYVVLAFLYDAPEHELRASALAANARLSRSRLSHALRGMEASGWIARRPDPDDGRGQRVAITDAGLALVRRLAPLQIAAVRRPLLDLFDDAELDQLAELCERVVAQLDDPAAGV